MCMNFSTAMTRSNVSMMTPSEERSPLRRSPNGWKKEGRDGEKGRSPFHTSSRSLAAVEVRQLL